VSDAICAAPWQVLISHSWRLLWRDWRLPLCLGLMIALAALAGVLDEERRQSIAQDRLAAELLDEQTFIAQGARNPHSVAHFSRFAFRPLPATMTLDPGIVDYAGSAVWMEAHAQDPANVRAAEDRVDLGRLADANLAWLLQVLAPLLIIALGYDAVAGEIQRGTWPLLLGAGASPSRLLRARGLAIFLPMLALLLAVGLLHWIFAPSTEAESDRAVRVLVWMGGHGLFLAFWVATCLLVSARSRTARAALISLLALWAMVVLALPRLAATVANDLAPTPAPSEFSAQIQRDLEQGMDGHNPADARRKAFEQRVLTQYGVTKVEDLPVSFAGLSLQESENYGNQVFDRHYASLVARFDQQANWQRLFGLLTPLPALQRLSMASAGTDVAHYIDFIQQAEASRREIVRFLNDDMTRNAVGREDGPRDFDYLADAALWAATPTFTYVPPRPLTFASALLPDLAVLMAWLVLIGLLWRRAMLHLEQPQ